MSAARSGAPVRSAGVRRLLQEAQELERDDCSDYAAAPLEDDIFSWHFTVRGPKSSDFEGGLYHGRLVLPSEYPFKPPEVYMLTPSGRFEINKKICLSISSFHPETWQPSWGIRTALVALMAFFESEAKGAVGSLDAPPAERQRMARSSLRFKCATCGFDPTKPDSFAALAEPASAQPSTVNEEEQVPVTVAQSAESSADQVVVQAASPLPDSRKLPPASIETTIFPTSTTASARSPSAGARHARDAQSASLDHNPFASAYHHHHHHHSHPVSSGSPSLNTGPGNAASTCIPPGAPRLSPAHLPTHTPASYTAPAPNPLRSPDLVPSPAAVATDLHPDSNAMERREASPVGPANTAAASGARSNSPSATTPPHSSATTTARNSHNNSTQERTVQLPALPPGVSLAQVSSGGVGGPPSWVDRAIVACLLALVALVVRKIA